MFMLGRVGYTLCIAHSYDDLYIINVKFKLILPVSQVKPDPSRYFIGFVKSFPDSQTEQTVSLSLKRM